jgi:hypothetical protein
MFNPLVNNRVAGEQGGSNNARDGAHSPMASGTNGLTVVGPLPGLDIESRRRLDTCQQLAAPGCGPATLSATRVHERRRGMPDVADAERQ